MRVSAHLCMTRHATFKTKTQTCRICYTLSNQPVPQPTLKYALPLLPFFKPASHLAYFADTVLVFYP